MDLFRKPKKRGFTSTIVRQRPTSDEDEDVEIKDVVRKRKRANPMIQTTKKKSEQETARSSSSDDSEEDPSVAVAEHSFAATGDAGPSGPRDQGATATLEIDTDYTADAQAQFERVQKQLKEGMEKDGKVLYKGAAMYGAKEAKDTVKGNAASGMNRIGPVRAPQFLRQTVRWDFAPDICKDYKETGYCTFGDSCKFVHDRSDYKHGWEIDQEFEEGRYGAEDDEDYEIKEEEDMFPDDCFICGDPFNDPIVTKCKHYFCEGCALKHFRTSAKCPVCNQNTEKIMNAAKDLITYLKRKKAAAAALEENEPEEEVANPSDAACSHEHHHEEHDEDHSSVDGSPSPVDELEQGASENDDVNESGEEEIVMEDVEGLDGGDNGDSESDDSS